MVAGIEATLAPERAPYRVQLDIFEGPLGLLLHLVRENELDIYDIPIALITEQYLRHLDLMRSLNLEVAGEFLVMAAHLTYLKSRALLPQEPAAEEEGESFEELKAALQEQLIEYQRFRALSSRLREAEGYQSLLYGRREDGNEALAAEEEPPGGLSLFDLVGAFERVLREAGEGGVHLVEVEELEVADRQGFILERLEGSGPEGLPFGRLFASGATPLEWAVTFLALLQLMFRRLVVALQRAPFGEILILKAVTDD
ncbi:MAG: segregation and condensation protein A [Nitrospinota bacterium]